MVESDPARTDVACFVGLARADGRGSAAGDPELAPDHGWTDGPFARSIEPPFTDIPIPLENYAAFTSLFDPGGSASSYGTDYLAAAVRSFSLRVAGDATSSAWTIRLSPRVTNAAARRKAREAVARRSFAADDRRSWHGAGHWAVCRTFPFWSLPDLPALMASAPSAAALECRYPSTPARRSLSSARRRLPLRRRYRCSTLPAPRLTPRRLPDMGPERADRSEHDPDQLPRNSVRGGFSVAAGSGCRRCRRKPIERELAQDIHDVIASQMPENTPPATSRPLDGLPATCLIPGSRPRGSIVLNESWNRRMARWWAFSRATHSHAGRSRMPTKIVPAEISDVSPLVARAGDSDVPLRRWFGATISTKPLIIRLSLFGFTPAGLRLLSDVTAYPGEAYRPACIHRLVAVISRASRQLGEQIVFAQNGPALWARVETSLGQLLIAALDTECARRRDHTGGFLSALRRQHHDAKRYR